MLWDGCICGSLRRVDLIWREEGGMQKREEEISFSPLEEAKVEGLDNSVDATPCKAA
jgi:hypothetical protein